ncbi:ABC transporter ATP-binding protein [Seleniivibrio woodruffii]|uniref:ABC-2 type transport system ATP-binding protein n=1 Tax=Seleniivibrio woodruffii TaxID=1078050 RepID=A0A4R1K8R9_9BACT|nr:ABC transporter ATP-binding protein [Seleniivibrio woodruffii]TCK60756.1 ABC-2 type transport system ATP-binding protein [Seleniivibrio woodruffii]TVZ36386.1 ABC-2 type transport system ATP-binding protein [Seleniivibrio woodruffii]
MLIETVDLVKKFDKKAAVDGISLSIAEGESVALLGPNGAGKTTTVNMLTGLSQPTSGKIFYNGKEFDNKDIEIKKTIGVVPQHNNVDRDLTVEQNLIVHAKLFGIKDIKAAVDEAVTFSGLEAHRTKEAEKLSGGMKRRLVIARALMHKPKVLFLDEPTTGLDASVRRTLWSFIRSINKTHGCTVIMTTHYIEEAEMLSDHVVIIDNGKIAAEGKTGELKESVGRFALDIYKESDIETMYFDTRQEALQTLENITAEARIREVTLEDVYLRITGRRMDA